MKVDGVKEARVDWREGRAWARYDPARTTPERLVESINSSTTFKASLPAVKQ